MEIYTGIFLGNTKGFGFVKISESEPDIFIAPNNKKGAMNGDEVEVKVFDEGMKHGTHKEGVILNILKRNTKGIVGIFKKSRNFGFVIPDDKALGGDIFISKSNWGKAKDNQKVVVNITKYPSKDKKAEGKIVEILGFFDEAGIDMLSIIKQYDLPNEFPRKVLLEAEKVSKEKIKLGNRMDFRGERTFTIDGDEAKDLDDAISIKKYKDGTYCLKVHIADVSHYVKDGTELNKEAIKRGTSVYMLNKVIPMLPKELSNGVCSLNEGQDRYAISVVMKIGKDGKVIDSDICKSLIKVTRRMTYTNVAKILDKSDKKILLKYKQYEEDFKLMEKLAQIIKERRIKDGYLSLDIPESKITLDENGIPVNIEEYKITFAHEIIEQFMLTANETVAERFYFLNAPFIYRVHETPDEEKIKELNKTLHNLGYKIKGNLEKVKPKALSQILEKVKGQDEEFLISNLILRTLKVAKYEAENRGHFGISSKYYCHFTSPIRRYPDLFIHRVISNYLESDYMISDKFKNKYWIKAEQLAESSSKCEQIASKAERESESIKKAEYMEGKIGETFEGIISGITAFGIFVILTNTIEGLISLTDLRDDYYIFNEERKTLVGKKTGKRYYLGKKVNVKVLNASKEKRKIEFELID